MKVVIDNQESCYLNLLCAIEAEIKIIQTYKRLKIIEAKTSTTGDERITASPY